MSELQVESVESSDTFIANSITVGNNVVVNSAGIIIPGSVTVNLSSIAIGNASSNVIVTANTTIPHIFIGNMGYLQYSGDLYSWAEPSILVNCTIGRDYGIVPSPFNGIPLKITPTGKDPYPATYNSNTWNIAPTASDDVWKISGYIRVDGDYGNYNPSGTGSSGKFLLVLPANSSGMFGSAGEATIGSPTYNLKANVWTYFESVATISGNANTAYLQVRLDGEQTGIYTTWYDGLTIEKAKPTYLSEIVNTQIFTANGTWTKPSWATDGKELVIVHMWGGGGGGATATAVSSAGGGGGAFAYGYYIANNLSSTVAVTVGDGGIGGSNANGAIGGNSVFNTTFIAGGGSGAFCNSSFTAAGAGGGWFTPGTTAATGGVGGHPVGGANTGAASTFGGGGSGTASIDGGLSIYGGGGGTTGNRLGGSSVYGGGGGTQTGNSSSGLSVYGGRGAYSSVAATIPGGGGGGFDTGVANGARGEVRVYTLRIVS